MIFERGFFMFRKLLIGSTVNIVICLIISTITSGQTLQQSAYISHGNEIVLADEPECNNENHRSRIVILPVLVPHHVDRSSGGGGGGGTQIKILPMNQIPIIIKAKRGNEQVISIDPQSIGSGNIQHHSNNNGITSSNQHHRVRGSSQNQHVSWPFQQQRPKLALAGEEKPEGFIIDADYSLNRDSPSIRMQKMRDHELPILSQLLIKNTNQKDFEWDYLS